MNSRCSDVHGCPLRAGEGEHLGQIRIEACGVREADEQRIEVGPVLGSE